MHALGERRPTCRLAEDLRESGSSGRSLYRRLVRQDQNVPEPIALGRSVVVGLGDAAPGDWSSCKRIRVAGVTRAIADDLGAAWRDRRSTHHRAHAGPGSRRSRSAACRGHYGSTALGVVGRPGPRGRAASPRRVGQLDRRTRRFVAPAVAMGRARMQSRCHPHRTREATSCSPTARLPSATVGLSTSLSRIALAYQCFTGFRSSTGCFSRSS